MNIINYVKKLFELVDSDPTTNHRALYDLEQIKKEIGDDPAPQSTTHQDLNTVSSA